MLTSIDNANGALLGTIPSYNAFVYEAGANPYQLDIFTPQDCQNWLKNSSING